MARTYSKGRKRYKRNDHKHGHCFMCGWCVQTTWSKQTALKKFMKFDIEAYLIEPDFVES